jgi:hypothetical protein
MTRPSSLSRAAITPRFVYPFATTDRGSGQLGIGAAAPILVTLAVQSLGAALILLVWVLIYQHQRRHRSSGPDGSVVLNLAPEADELKNHLYIMDGWNYALRLYLPHAEVVDKTWTPPTPHRVD